MLRLRFTPPSALRVSLEFCGIVTESFNQIRDFLYIQLRELIPLKQVNNQLRCMSSQITDAAQDNTPSGNPLRNHTTLDSDLSPFTRYKALRRVELVSNKARDIDRQRHFPSAGQQYPDKSYHSQTVINPSRILSEVPGI
jgi:hypothetical protein